MPPPKAAHMHGEQAWVWADHSMLFYDDWPEDRKNMHRWGLFESSSWSDAWKIVAVHGAVSEDDVFEATRAGETASFRVVKTYPTRRKVTTCAVTRL
jgi:hypothetical protein